MRAGSPSLLAPTESKKRAAERSAVEAGEITGSIAPNPEWDHADAVLVLVHGMGEAHRSQILLEWAEPLLARLDWMTRDRTLRERTDDALDYAEITARMEADGIGVTLHNVDLTGDQPIITATVGYPDDDDIARRRIAMLEARWSESFTPMTRSEVFHWAVRFLWRAIRRVIRLFVFTMVMSTFASFWKRREPAGQGSSSRMPRWLARIARVSLRIALYAVDAVRFLAAVVLAAVSTLVVLAFGAVVSVILPLLTPLLLIPAVQRVAQSAIDTVVESIGDVATWKERPSRATAMRLAIRSTLGVAEDLATSKSRQEADGVVHVLAHSQGAALAAYALLEEDWTDIRVDHLHTVGAAVTLLGRDRWRGRPDVYNPVARWKPRREAMTWTNYTATWDPFAAGPIADTDADARRRWRTAYGARESGAAGPEERLVHNSSQPFTDHQVYHRNLVQVVDPIARALVPGLRRPTEEWSVVANTLSVMTRRALGIGLACAVMIGVLLPTIPAVSEALARGIQWTTGMWDDLMRVLTPWVERNASEPTGGFLVTAGADPQYDPVLSGAGWLVASLLIAAVLTWIVQLLAKVCEQTRDWRRCPARPLPWLLITSLPRLLLVSGAMLTIGLATRIFWETSSAPIPFLVVMGLVGAGLLLFLEPWLGIVPSVVPPRKERGEPVTAPAPATAFDGVLAAARSDPFTGEWDRRHALRRSEPPGPIRAFLRRLRDWIAAAGRRETPRHA